MKLFENENYDEFILPLDKFKLFSDTDGKFPTDDKNLCRELCERADKTLEEEIPQLYAHAYMRFMKPGDGNRSCFETPYFERRQMLYILLLGELASDFSGKYMEKIVDILWLIMDESTWITNAHNRISSGGNAALPFIFEDEKFFYFDLFCAETAALLAVVYHFLHEKLDRQIADIVNSRILHMIKVRVLDPFLKYDDMWWMGFYRDEVNNWCPWIVSNVLTVCALTEGDLDRRRKITAKALLCLDNFVKGYAPDGGCNEGPGYWDAAGAALFSALETLYDMSGGKINKFDNPLLYNMLDYIRKVNLSENYYTCFADAHLRAGGDDLLVYRMGVKTGNSRLSDFAVSRITGADDSLGVRHADPSTLFQFLRTIKNYFFPYPKNAEKYSPDAVVTLPDLQVAVLRSGDGEKCLYTVAAKGGHNSESHNHNDVGSFVVYRKGEPLIVDIGAPTYTKALFDERRYTLFPLNSFYHNLPVINGRGQITGRNRCADSFRVCEEERTVAISYKNAYENRDEIKACGRKITVLENSVEIKEHIELKSDGDVLFNLYACEKPTVSECGKLCFENGASIKAEGAAVSCTAIPIEDGSLKEDWERDTFYKIVLTPKHGRVFDVTVTFE